MKNVIFAISLSLCVTMVSGCTMPDVPQGNVRDEMTETLLGKVQHPTIEEELARTLNPAVGDPVHTDLAIRWINNFRRRNAPPSIVLSYDITRQTIEQLLAVSYAGQRVDGLRLIKGINNKGRETLIVIPVQRGKDVWYLPDPDSVDRAGAAHDEQGSLPADIARVWISDFRHANHFAEGHRSYFVGSEALQQMVSTMHGGSPIDGLRFHKAYNDDNRETLVVAPVQDGRILGALGRRLLGTVSSNSLLNTDEVVYFEYIFPCPASCLEVDGD